jgi:hypothetical protein
VAIKDGNGGSSEDDAAARGVRLGYRRSEKMKELAAEFWVFISFT